MGVRAISARSARWYDHGHFDRVVAGVKLDAERPSLHPAKTGSPGETRAGGEVMRIDDLHRSLMKVTKEVSAPSPAATCGDPL